MRVKYKYGKKRFIPSDDSLDLILDPITPTRAPLAVVDSNKPKNPKIPSIKKKDSALINAAIERDGTLHSVRPEIDSDIRPTDKNRLLQSLADSLEYTASMNFDTEKHRLASKRKPLAQPNFIVTTVDDNAIQIDNEIDAHSILSKLDNVLESAAKKEIFPLVASSPPTDARLTKNHVRAKKTHLNVMESRDLSSLATKPNRPPLQIQSAPIADSKDAPSSNVDYDDLTIGFDNVLESAAKKANRPANARPTKKHVRAKKTHLNVMESRDLSNFATKPPLQIQSALIADSNEPPSFNLDYDDLTIGFGEFAHMKVY
jgi:hypothetical protein